jgi:hypothetical protein
VSTAPVKQNAAGMQSAFEQPYGATGQHEIMPTSSTVIAKSVKTKQSSWIATVRKAHLAMTKT